ncbi:hypothetical protein ANCDUO_10324 [Ancylostoma duodenale]|uniref:Uncharacterized protein n=1 Tax=Ancylostoma duodenale TaxID=51022 RepID=A0A0C2GE52_9BILA|nr:hypothetical protein ANCDUO_10324 [Ancylostoma duodenale]
MCCQSARRAAVVLTSCVLVLQEQGLPTGFLSVFLVPLLEQAYKEYPKVNEVVHNRRSCCCVFVCRSACHLRRGTRLATLIRYSPISPNIHKNPFNSFSKWDICFFLLGTFFQIVKFATEEQPSRSVLELAGARHIFNALTDRVSAELQDAEAINDGQLPLLVQSVSSKVLPSASDIQLCLFWVSVTPGKAARLINPFIGQLLHNFFVIIVSSREKTVIRTEFVIRCITAYLEVSPLVDFYQPSP